MTLIKKSRGHRPWCHGLSDLCRHWSGWVTCDQNMDWSGCKSAPLHAEVQSHLSGSTAIQPLAAGEGSWHCNFFLDNTLLDLHNSIPANFFWDISVRFLSWECWDFWRRHDHFRRFLKKSEDFRRRPKSSEDIWSLLKAKLSSPSLRTRINASSLPVLFTSKIRDREEGIVIYSFYTWLSFLTWVLHGQQLTFFNQAWEIGPQAWAGVRSKFSTRRRETHA